MRVCLIGGPTAAGKTAVGVELARRWRTEIVSADSMQVYRGLWIGTAKPSARDRRDVPYHLIDCLDPSERFSAARFLHEATPILDRLLAEGRVPLVVGGTGLYLQALREGLFEAPAIPPAVRRRLEAAAAREGSAALHERLAAVDPTAAARTAPSDGVRIVRALEVYEATGKTITQWRQEGRRQGVPYATALFVLNAPRQALYERVNRRVEAMFEAGLVDETRRLLAQGVSPHWHCMRALGYANVVDHLEGRADLEETMEAVKQTHRNYAKRQLTWFRRMAGACWVSVEGRDAGAVADALEKNLATQITGRR